MRIGVISDIHGNRFALESVLRSLDDIGIDRLICLGDIVGYGPDPAACLDLIFEREPTLVIGNHEEALLDPVVSTRFRDAAREAIDWTRRRLRLERPELIQRLAQQSGMEYIGAAVMCVHDSPIPGGVRYLIDAPDAAAAFRGVDVPICLVGHTHLPVAFQLVDGGERLEPDVVVHRPPTVSELRIDASDRWIINPGAVGQPRDGDSRASFLTIDLAKGAACWHRVAYDVGAAQRRALAMGLPPRTAERLAVGA